VGHRVRGWLETAGRSVVFKGDGKDEVSSDCKRVTFRGPIEI